MTGLGAAVLCAAALWLLMPSPAAARLSTETRARQGLPPLVPIAVLVVAAVAGAGLLVSRSAGLWLAIAVVVLATVARVVWARRRDRARRRRRTEVARAARVLAAQLRIGQVPTTALRAAAEDCRPLERAAATMAVGGDVAVALREAGVEPGHAGLIDLAMAWEISERSGAPVAELAGGVAEALRADETTRTAVTAELAAPRATGRMLAVLPLVGIALGTVAGGRPVAFLTGNLAGQCCLFAGVSLACAGVLWTEWLADRAQS